MDTARGPERRRGGVYIIFGSLTVRTGVPLSLQILQFRTARPSAGAALMSYSFCVPDFMHPQAFVNITISSPATASQAGYFHSDPQDRLLLLQDYRDSPYLNQTGKFDVDIPVRTFTSYIASHPVDGTAVTIPWREWGPRGSRGTWAPIGPFRRAMAGLVVGGLRRVELRAGDGGGPATAVVLDYHPQRVARALARQRSGDTGDVVLHGGDITGLGSEPHGAFKTMLPCTVVEISLPEEVCRLASEMMVGVWLTEDGLVFAQKYDGEMGIRDAWAYTF
ncbi:hypothetical protein BV25DRAFT_1833467 [Artomyces pyxidatus]|uniref:Uncharacterized protein n=1 Tax=Artomyces pyxidatus TaxID=48021 RepID=A0ACB8SFU6_9AGAM|nr:hypothetical protein BV25DRAFT_1833467 [Artomyces pyxidatus]